MPVFFVPADQIKDGQVTISGPLLQHLRSSLRTRAGERIRLVTDAQRCYQVRVLQVDRQRLIGRIEHEERLPARTQPTLVLGQAILKGEKMDWLIQKATELGVASISPLITCHTIVRPAAARVNKQVERWQRIALEAAQQAERPDVPVVQSPQSAADFFAEQRAHVHNLILCERARGSSLADVPIPSDAADTLVMAIGPEGGWAQDEQQEACRLGFTPVTLGACILRAETAALACLSILQSRLGNLG